ncbi:unknown [[Mannheimia] succiniciproducens MBEL55E]|uniref:Uncharacterized protein n=1 Tax=Mannheimia succiniciproducens (strain KCTC 0769BP / MBEL55E) TaxID=221988 RepID=Q65VP7_MANSM|nr:unknown [[Mannheimia] succiniciproducens MBEL55E]
MLKNGGGTTKNPEFTYILHRKSAVEILKNYAKIYRTFIFTIKVKFG